MTRAIKITIIVTLLLTVVREMAAQEKNQIHKTEVSVDFRWDWAVIDGVDSGNRNGKHR